LAAHRFYFVVDILDSIIRQAAQGFDNAQMVFLLQPGLGEGIGYANNHSFIFKRGDSRAAKPRREIRFRQRELQFPQNCLPELLIGHMARGQLIDLHVDIDFQ
jgi:hypothetical protein